MWKKHRCIWGVLIYRQLEYKLAMLSWIVRSMIWFEYCYSKRSSSCSRSWIRSLRWRRRFWRCFIATTGRKFESEFRKCLDEYSFRNWFIDDCRKECSFFIHKVGLLVTCSRDYWSLARTLDTVKEDSLGVFWLWLLVDLIILATCSPETTGMCISQMITSKPDG